MVVCQFFPFSWCQFWISGSAESESDGIGLKMWLCVSFVHFLGDQTDSLNFTLCAL